MSDGAIANPAAEARRGHIAMLAFSALVAGSFSLGGQIANEIAPTALNAIRFVIAAAAIWAVVRVRGGVPGFAWAAPWRYLILGGFFAVYFVTMFEGLKTAPPVSAAAVFTLTPVMSAGFGWLMLRQGVNPRIVAALGLGAVGALWVIFRADWAAFTAFEVGRGEAIFFWGCVAHAAYTPAVRWLNRGEPVLVFTFLTLSACAGILLVYGAGEIRATDWLGLRPLVWVTLIYVALIASSTTVFLVQYASMRLPSAKVMAYTYLTPSWVLLWELALGQPVPPAMVLVGVVLSFGAVALLLKE
ncbi:DMT family transporter [Roseibacterium beibuensis]|uniref:DMT family transporter n=1 Tax=[Roseibacterium] beibuensis TaxID=1193142 RepID=A0ABP9L891_9RHOB|nr:DMT family transporter [Roseibacterium beibuensis]MCS6624281.1 DMT family transporter [Roseibacterium beibuensis]